MYRRKLDIREITPEQAAEIYETGLPLGRFWFIDDGTDHYVGLDNSAGEYFVEESADFETIVKWLLHEIEAEDL